MTNLDHSAPELFDIYWTGLFVGFFSLVKPALDVLVLQPLAKKMVPENIVPSAKTKKAAATKKRKEAVLSSKEEEEEEEIDTDELDDIDADEFFENNGKIVKKKTRSVSSSERAQIITRFRESSWRFLYYSISWAIGLWICSQEPWFEQPAENFFKGWPNHPMSFNLKMYYLSSLAFYIYSILTCASESKKKDDLQMMLHHIITIVLIVCSFLTGFHRIGAMVLLVHDIADPFLELAKMFNYSAMSSWANSVFALFVVVWTATRLVYYPYVIVRATIQDFRDDIIMENNEDFWWILFSSCLSGLQVMHVLWTVSILRILRDAVIHKGVQGDVREE